MTATTVPLPSVSAPNPYSGGNMGGTVLVLFYGSILFCVIASAVRMTKYVSAPLHLRWELYRGSSVYELTDWWMKSPRHLGGRLRGVILDVLLLREFYRLNRSFWYFLFLFHLGLYLLFVWHLWLFVTAVTLPFEAAGDGWLVFGHIATALSLIGGSGILIKRAVDRELNVYYPRVHYVKWLLILLILAGGFLAVVFHFDSDVPQLLRYVNTQVTFQDLELKLHPALGPASHVFFVSFWLLYLPFSHVLRLFFRYYQYLRWDDVPNASGSTIERKVQDNLNRPVGWSAPHIKAGKAWREVIRETEDL
jgi:nitrate reductase gamma subunit